MRALVVNLENTSSISSKSHLTAEFSKSNKYSKNKVSTGNIMQYKVTQINDFNFNYERLSMTRFHEGN